MAVPGTQAEMEKGLRSRTTSATLLNASSSRSHSGIMLHVSQRSRGVMNTSGEAFEAKLHLVDLAGASPKMEGLVLDNDLHLRGDLSKRTHAFSNTFLTFRNMHLISESVACLKTCQQLFEAAHVLSNNAN